MVKKESESIVMNAGGCRGTMGCGWVLVPCLLVLCALPHLTTSLDMVCKIYNDVVSLHEYEKVLIYTRDESVFMKIRSEPCDMSYTFLVNVKELLGNNTELQDYRERQWYEISYSTERTVLQVRLVGNTTINLNRTWEPLLTCNMTNGIEFSFDDDTVIGAYCFDTFIDRDIHNVLAPALDESLYNFGSSNVDQYEYRGSYSSQHVIFFPVGAFLFLISVCCRCWFRRKRALQPVRTITVVRSLSTTDTDALQNDLDLPPAYADIQNEMAPPSYSEIEKLAIPATEMTSPVEFAPTGVERPPEQIFGEEATDDGNTRLVSPDPSGVDSSSEESDSSSTLPRRLSSRSRNLQDQFSFKPLHEEE